MLPTLGEVCCRDRNSGGALFARRGIAWGRSRRWFLRRSVAAPVVLILVAAGGSAMWRRAWPPTPARLGGIVQAGRPEDYDLGEVRHWPQGRFHLVRVPQGFLALYDRCPHLGCPIPAPRNGVFECRCHFSRFALDGSRLSGPAERPMDLLPVTMSQGALLVSTGESAVLRRSGFDIGQVFKP